MRHTYSEADKGRFEAWLVRNDDTAVAYTYGNEVRVTEFYMECDQEAVEEFADSYDCTVVWH